jgi:hypothetical protein
MQNQGCIIFVARVGRCVRSISDATRSLELYPSVEGAMTTKTRLVLVDDDDREAMQQDLADPAVMEYYWQHTGSVETYWVSVSDFRFTFPGRDVPRDGSAHVSAPE